jgi:hypothetical protein
MKMRSNQVAIAVGSGEKQNCERWSATKSPA